MWSFWKIYSESDDRIGRSFDLSSYNLTFEDVLIEKVTLEILVESFSTIFLCFGTTGWMARFFIISNVASENNYFGKGFGQSYEILVDDIQKPHSLILTTFYVGKFGLVIYLFYWCFIYSKKLEKERIVLKIFKSSYCLYLY